MRGVEGRRSSVGGAHPRNDRRPVQSIGHGRPELATSPEEGRVEDSVRAAGEEPRRDAGGGAVRRRNWLCRNALQVEPVVEGFDGDGEDYGLRLGVRPSMEEEEEGEEERVRARR